MTWKEAFTECDVVGGTLCLQSGGSLYRGLICRVLPPEHGTVLVFVDDPSDPSVRLERFRDGSWERTYLVAWTFNVETHAVSFDKDAGYLKVEGPDGWAVLAPAGVLDAAGDAGDSRFWEMVIA